MGRPRKNFAEVRDQVPLAFEDLLQAGETPAIAESIAQPESNQRLLEEQLGQAAMKVFCWLYRRFRSACRGGNIRAEHLPTLDVLEKDPALNLTDLAKELGVHPTTVERQVEALEKNGCVSSRRGRLKKRRARIPKLEIAGREELTHSRAHVGSDLRLLNSDKREGEELAKSLERLLAISKRAPR